MVGKFNVCKIHRMLNLLDIDLKMPLTCCVNCVGAITEAPVAQSKQNLDASAEMSHKLRGWHNRKCTGFLK